MRPITLEDIGRLAVAARLARLAWANRVRCEVESPPEPEVGHHGDPPCYMMTEGEREAADGMCAPCMASESLWADRRRAQNALCAAIGRYLKRQAAAAGEAPRETPWQPAVGERCFLFASREWRIVERLEDEFNGVRRYRSLTATHATVTWFEVPEYDGVLPLGSLPVPASVRTKGVS